MKHLSINTFALLAFLAACITSQTESYANKKVALVIGNSAYSFAPLKNPKNDANDMSHLFLDSGFHVTKVTNATLSDFDHAVNTFSKHLQTAEIAIFYYAGHGVQLENENYLIPINAHIMTENDMRKKGFKVSEILKILRDKGNRLSIIILDACRNNPFEGKIDSVKKGLAYIDSPEDILIGYATSPGAVALDGDDRNGVYTSHLIENFKNKSLPIWDVFNKTGLDVIEHTGGAQKPWISSSITNDYYLARNNNNSEYFTPSRDIFSGSLSIVSYPPHADVFIDGKHIGYSPITLSKLDRGLHYVNIMKSGYVKKYYKISIDELTAKKKLEIDLESSNNATGRLHLNVFPEGASVKIIGIDEIFKNGLELEEGTYTVELSLKEYEKKIENVIIEGGVVTNKTIALKPTQNFAHHPRHRPHGNTYTDRSIGMQFNYVKGGCYNMGDEWLDGEDDELPVHKVCVNDFYIGKFEVSFEEYIKLNNTLRVEDNKLKRPVNNVSWFEAQQFVTKMSKMSDMKYRLPTEAEWEFAARSGGLKQKYSGGNVADQYGWHVLNSSGHIRYHGGHDAGYKSPNSINIYDMSGNVWEWCQDWYDFKYYSQSPQNNPRGKSAGTLKVLRGGGIASLPRKLRTTQRYAATPESRHKHFGFRVVLIPD